MNPNDAVSTASRPPGRTQLGPLLAGAFVSISATAGLLGLAWDLGRDLATLVGSGPGVQGVLVAARVEDLVAGVALLLALALGTWLSLGLAAAAGCVAARQLGHQWRLGEALVARTAPAVVRRAVALSAGTSVALASAALPAAALVTPPPVDLGWSPTVAAPAWPAPGAASPEGAGARHEHAAAGGGSDDARAEAEALPTPGPQTSAPVALAAAPNAETPGPVTSPTPLVPVAGQSAPPAETAPDGAPQRAGAAPSTDPQRAGAAPSTDPQRAGAAPSTDPQPAAAAPSAEPVGDTASGGRATDTAVDVPGTPGPAGGGPRPSVAVTVQPGDTLWGIAADFLPTGATPADVAAAWPQWYAANREAIGPDPDLIQPGQRLVRPATVPSADVTATANGAGS